MAVGEEQAEVVAGLWLKRMEGFVAGNHEGQNSTRVSTEDNGCQEDFTEEVEGV